MDLTSRPMTTTELAAWLGENKASFVAELVAAGRDRQRAEARVEAQYGEWFPNGQPGERHQVLVVEQDGTRVAIVWLGPSPQRANDASVAWLYDIEVDSDQRGRGLGRGALALAEQVARAAGASRLELNVFGGNALARGLYRSAGYEEIAVTMAKTLDDPA